MKEVTTKDLKAKGKRQNKLSLITKYSELYNEIRYYLKSKGIVKEILDLNEIALLSCNNLERGIKRLDREFETLVEVLS